MAIKREQKCWMEVAVPAVVKALNKISVSPKLDTIFEEEEDEDFEDS